MNNLKVILNLCQGGLALNGSDAKKLGEQFGLINAAAVLLQDERDRHKAEVAKGQKEINRLQGLMREVRAANDDLKALLPVYRKDVEERTREKNKLLQQVRDQSTMIQNQRRTIANYQSEDKT